MDGLCTPEQLVQFLDRHREQYPVDRLAEASGVSKSTIFALLARKDTGSIRMDTFQKLAEAVGCQIVVAVGAKANPLLGREAVRKEAS